MAVDTVTVQNTGNALGELAFPNKETFKSKNNIASLDSNGRLLLAQAPYTAGAGIRISNLGVISATGGGSGGGGDEHNKGWYATPDQLPATGENGDYAIVGSTDTVWIWDGDTSSWVDSGAKGSVTKVNGKTGEVVLNAEDIETTESIVLVGDAGTTLEAAIATVAQNTHNNSTLAGNTAVKTQFISATTSTHTTTIGGILDVINNDSVADIRINGQSLDTKFNAKQDKITAGDGIVLSDNNVVSAKLLTVEGKSPNSNGNIDISAADVNAYTTEQVDAKLDTKQDSLTADGNITITKDGSLTKIASPIYKAGTGINISDDFTITATGGVKGTVTSVNNQTPDDSGNVSLTTANIPNLSIGDDNITITIGSKSVVPLTADSPLDANNIDGTVESATKASQDGAGNTISTYYQPKSFKIGEDNVTVEGLLVEQKSALDQTYIEASNNGIVIKGNVVIPQLASNLVTTFSTEPSDTKYPSEKLVAGEIDKLNTAIASKSSQSDLTTLQNKVTNISTSDGKTIVTGTLEVVGASDTDIPTVDTGENGQVLTNTIVVSDEIDTAKIAMSGNTAVKIESFDTSISSSSTNAGLPTSKAVYTAILNVDSAKANKDATNISTPQLVTAWKEKLEIDVIEADLDTKQTKVTSTVEVNVAPTTAKTATAITGALAKSARVVVVPKYTNIGAVYVKETNTFSAVNPIYPDPVNNVYEFNNMQNVKVFVDSLGDSVDLIIEYRG